jgi:hypothetical protein
MEHTASKVRDGVQCVLPVCAQLSDEDVATMFRVLAAVLILALLASCTARVDGPSVRVRPATVEIDSGDDGRFCPPGQAKKGRC